VGDFFKYQFVLQDLLLAFSNLELQVWFIGKSYALLCWQCLITADRNNYVSLTEVIARIK